MVPERSNCVNKIARRIYSYCMTSALYFHDDNPVYVAYYELEFLSFFLSGLT